MPICKNDSKATYKGDEPSPKGLGYCAHAEKLGTKKKGLDKNIWIVKHNVNNIKQWIKVKLNKEILTEKKIGTKYLIHDNGSRPFEVVINKLNVSIYKKTKLDSDDYDKLIKKYKVIKVFIGKDSAHNNKIFNGNTILLHLGGQKYICVSNSIFEFELTPDDNIVKYFSMVGNSDVPYPVLLGEINFYSMVNKQYCSREEFPHTYKIKDFEDSHGYFFGKLDPKKGWISPIKVIKKLPKLKIIKT